MADHRLGCAKEGNANIAFALGIGEKELNTMGKVEQLALDDYFARQAGNGIFLVWGQLTTIPMGHGVYVNFVDTLRNINFPHTVRSGERRGQQRKKTLTGCNRGGFGQRAKEPIIVIDVVGRQLGVIEGNFILLVQTHYRHWALLVFAFEISLFRQWRMKSLYHHARDCGASTIHA